MENFEIPERITAFDSRMKLIAAHYYCPDKQTRTENFKRLFNACASASIRRELEKYWASMPLRLAKKSAKQGEEEEIYKPQLSLQPKNLQREVKLLLEEKKKDRELKIKQRPPQLVYVPWETIEFCNGRVMFYPFRLNGALILKSRTPFVVNCKESKAIYNHIRKHFANVLPLIRAYQKGSDIVGLESEIHLLDAIRILQSKQDFVEWESDDSGIKFSFPFEKSIKQDYDKILANLRLRKSSYFDYLSQVQIKGKNPVPCTELLTHTYGIGENEDAFIFSVKSFHCDEVKLVFENVNEARATIVFEVMANMYEKALRCIFDFMRSDEYNKRQRLHYKKFNFQNHGITRYYFINHTTVREWKYNL